MDTSGARDELGQALQAFLERRAAGDSGLGEPAERLLIALAEENRRLRAGLAELARRHERLAARLGDEAPGTAQSLTTALRRATLRRPSPPPPQRVERPLSYWAANVPAYGQGDALSSDEAARYLARPRVDPASIALTEADLARQPSARKRYLRDHAIPREHYLWSMLAAVAILLTLIVLALAFVGLIWIDLSNLR